MLPNERRRFLATVGRRSTVQALERRGERRYPILLALVAQSAVDQLDEVVALFDQAVSARESRAKSKTDEDDHLVIPRLTAEDIPAEAKELGVRDAKVGRMRSGRLQNWRAPHRVSSAVGARSVTSGSGWLSAASSLRYSVRRSSARCRLPPRRCTPSSWHTTRR